MVFNLGMSSPRGTGGYTLTRGESVETDLSRRYRGFGAYYRNLLLAHHLDLYKIWDSF